MSPTNPRQRPAAASTNGSSTAAPPPSAPTDQERLEFLRAIDAFKRKTNRSFPTWTEVLDLVHGLGYRRTAPKTVDS